jgi:hypothetical protein
MSVVATSGDQKAIAIPAYFVNRFQIAHSRGSFVRLSLAEAVTPGEGCYRAAVVMSELHAKELALSILNLLGDTSKKPS